MDYHGDHQVVSMARCYSSSDETGEAADDLFLLVLAYVWMLVKPSINDKRDV